MILKKVNNIFVLDNIPEDALNIKMFRAAEYYINNVFIDNIGYFYVTDVLKLFKMFDEDFSFEIDDSISDDDRICSFVKFLFYREDYVNGRKRYKIVFRMKPNNIKKIRCNMYGVSMRDAINKVKLYKNDKYIILKKVNNIFVLDNIPEDAYDQGMFCYIEDAINTLFIDNVGYIYVKDVLTLLSLFTEDFLFELDDSISDDDRIRSFVKFIFCKGDCTNGEQRYKIVFRIFHLK